MNRRKYRDIETNQQKIKNKKEEHVYFTPKISLLSPNAI